MDTNPRKNRSERRSVGKSASGYALRGFPNAILYRQLTLQGKNGGAHNSHCATLHTSRLHDERLKSLGKFQRAPTGDVFDRVAIREHGRDGDHQDLLKVVQGAVARFAQIIDFAQTVHQTYSLLRRHFVRQKDESRRDFLSVYNKLLQVHESKTLSPHRYAVREYASRVRKPRPLPITPTTWRPLCNYGRF